MSKDKKHIRPLSTYRKVNPECHKRIFENDLIEVSSKKAKENEGYWMYAFFAYGKAIYKDGLPQEFPNFFYRDPQNKNNKGTITELGRLLLTGWYYNIEDWAKEVGMYVVNAYFKTKENFNDLEYRNLVKAIREDVGYYYHNENELKLFILNNFFKNELQQLLPPKPIELQKKERILEIVAKNHKDRKAKGIDHWINEAGFLEDYSYYLIELLEGYDIPYNDYDTWKQETEIENKEYFEKYCMELHKLRENYKQGLSSIKLPKAIE